MGRRGDTTGGKSAFEAADNCRAGIADEQDRVQRVPQAAKVFALAFGEFHRARIVGFSSSRGRFVAAYLAEFVTDFRMRALESH